MKMENEHLPIFLCLVASILAHYLLIFSSSEPTSTLQPVQTAVEFEFEERIVPPSDVDPVKEPVKTKNLSDKNTVVQKETIRKGQPETSPPRKRANLFPKNGLAAAPSPPPSSAKNSLSVPHGNPDLLPDINQGNLTMLNAKASLHAVFVRRVALKVFKHLKQEISKSPTGKVRVKAIMTRQGELKSISLLTPPKLRGALEAAVQRGFWDLNPPPEALSTPQEFHFIFDAELKRFRARGYSLTLGTGLL